MYDFTRRQIRDEVAITREARLGFAEVLAMVCAFGAMAGIVWWIS
jgi:hypothetical protein